MGAENGAPCRDDGECRGGRCIVESGAMGPQGFIGGYCVSFGRRPADSDYDSSSPLPRSNCPPGSAILPFQGTAEGDRTVCLRTCAIDGNECRAGYACAPLGDPSMPFATNSVCLPADCMTMPTACPAGYSCQTRGEVLPRP